jgi:hypothetical protein
MQSTNFTCSKLGNFTKSTLVKSTWKQITKEAVKLAVLRNFGLVSHKVQESVHCRLGENHAMNFAQTLAT